MRWPQSLRVRLTLWYSVLLAVPLIAFATASYLVVARALHNRTDRFLSDALTTFSRELLAERRATPTLQAALTKTLDEVHFRDLRIEILDEAGSILASTPKTLPDVGASFRVQSLLVTVDSRTLRLRGAYDLGDLEGVLAGLRHLFLIAIPALIGAAAAGGSILARRSLAPVAAMGSRAAEITASSLNERLPVSGSRELAGLAVVINELLDRLERSFAQQRRLVADASHELRTPAAIIRTEAEVTLSQRRDESQYRASMEVIRDATRRLTRVVEDLFLLARSDAGQPVMRAEALYLDDVVQDAARALGTVAERKQIRIAVSSLEEVPMQGDADLLGRLVLNLLDNAVRYSPPGASVEVRMHRSNGRCAIHVANGGPGISPEARSRVFEPFFRGDTSRSRDHTDELGGAGLGLAIARRIAEMHGGTLDLAESRPGRTEFRLSLPLSRGQAGA
jgi:heavy metal sensor kinase